jgi:CubicO group peptidase (beta-lactamase class C family)
MDDTCFNVPADKQPRLVSRFQRKEDGRLAETPRAPFKPVTFFSGGGGLFSTAEDYSKFARAILAGGRLGKQRILSAGSVAEMGRNQIGELPLRTPPSVIPSLVKEGGVLPGQPDKFGLGFALNTKPIEQGRGAHTLSWSGIYNTYFWVDREKKVCVVLLMQMLPALDDGPVGVVNDFDRGVYAWRASAKAAGAGGKD